MRIGVSCYPTYGGSGVVAAELALALAEEGDEVHVVSYAQPFRLKDVASPRVHFHPVEVPHYPLFEYPPYSLALATKIVDVARRHRLQVMHVHYAVPNAVSAVLARQMLGPQPLPVVTTLHGTDVTLVGNDPSYLETTRFGVLESDAVTAVSESLRRTTLEQLSIHRSIDVIPNFLDPRRFAPSAAELRHGEEKTLIHVSNFRSIKRPLDVLEIFRRVHEKLPCRLLLVGDGPERPRLEHEARAQGLEDVVVLLGQLPCVEEVLWQSDLFLLPSETESFGLAALEALACRVPVVASRVGGIPDVVVDGVHGLLYPVGDVDGMTRGALRLLQDDDLRARIGAEGRRWAFEQFDRASVVAQYRSVYRRVAAEVPV